MEYKKSYKKLFQEANEQAIDQYKTKRFFLRLLVLLVLDAGIVGMFIFGFKEHITASLLVILGIIDYLVIQAKLHPSTEDLQQKAKKFASTVYCHDVISALKTTVQLSPWIEYKIQEIIEKKIWLNTKTLTFEPHEHEFQHPDLQVKYQGNDYHLIGWKYKTKQPFHFSFEMILQNGLIGDKIEFKLYAPEIITESKVKPILKAVEQ